MEILIKSQLFHYFNSLLYIVINITTLLWKLLMRKMVYVFISYE